MKRITSLLAGTALASVLAAPAYSQALEDFGAFLATIDGELTIGETVELGAGTEYRDVVVTLEDITIELPWISEAKDGDDTVVTISPEGTFMMNGDEADLRTQGFVYRVGPDGNRTAHSLDIAVVDLVLDIPSEDNGSNGDLNGLVRVSDVSGGHVFGIGEDYDADGRFNVGAVEINIADDIAEAVGGGDSLAIAYDLSVPMKLVDGSLDGTEPSAEDIDAVLRPAIDATLSLGSAELTFAPKVEDEIDESFVFKAAGANIAVNGTTAEEIAGNIELGLDLLDFQYAEDGWRNFETAAAVSDLAGATTYGMDRASLIDLISLGGPDRAPEAGVEALLSAFYSIDLGYSRIKWSVSEIDADDDVPADQQERTLVALDTEAGKISGNFSNDEISKGGFALSTETFVIDVDIKNDWDDFATDLIYDIANFSMAFDFGMPVADLMELIEMEAQGAPEDAKGMKFMQSANMLMEFAYDTLRAEGSMPVEGLPLGFVASVETGRGNFGVQSGRLAYGASSENIAYDVDLAAMGMPSFPLSADRVLFDLGMTFVETPEPTNAIFEMRFENFVAGDGLWNMFDPGATIPRDPFTLIIDLVANYRLTGNPLEARMPNEVFDFEDIRINEVLVTGGGAEVTAEGSVDVDMSGPIPRGDGKVTASAKGIIGLTTAVSNLGLAPPEALLGIRGVLGAFANPVGEDEFVSEVIVSPDGTITANGVPIPIPQ